MRPSQEREDITLRELCHVGFSLPYRDGIEKKTENKLHVRDSINFNILCQSISGARKRRMEFMGDGRGWWVTKNGSKTTRSFINKSLTQFINDVPHVRTNPSVD